MDWHRKVTFSPSSAVCGSADRVTTGGSVEVCHGQRWTRTWNTSMEHLSPMPSLSQAGSPVSSSF